MGLERKKEDIDLPIFDLKTIANATNNSSHTSMLGEGGFGPVYKVKICFSGITRRYTYSFNKFINVSGLPIPQFSGNLSTGEEIVVKRLSKNLQQSFTSSRMKQL